MTLELEKKGQVSPCEEMSGKFVATTACALTNGDLALIDDDVFIVDDLVAAHDFVGFSGHQLLTRWVGKTFVLSHDYPVSVWVKAKGEAKQS